jgi:hypothetical protein
MPPVLVAKAPQAAKEAAEDAADDAYNQYAHDYSSDLGSYCDVIEKETYTYILSFF